LSGLYIMQTRRSKLTKRHKLTKGHKLTKQRSKNYKGGEPPLDDVSEIINTIKSDLQPSPGLKYAWIIFGISSGYILLKLLRK